MAKSNKEEKESVKLMEWAEDNIPVDDKEINFNIAKEAIKQIYDCFHIQFTSELTVLAFYSKVYEAIMKVLLNKRETKSEFVINIADRIEIGYKDSDDEDCEKQGSFVPFIYNIEKGIVDFAADDATENSAELCTQWEATNVKAQVKTLHEIATAAIKLLADVDIPNPNEVIIIPCFTVIHDSLVKYLKNYYDIYYYKQDDIDTYELNVNFANNFNVIVRKDADGNTVLEIGPNVSMKVSTKSDAMGGRNIGEE